MGSKEKQKFPVALFKKCILIHNLKGFICFGSNSTGYEGL